jgi:SAM-dependent methyltransferase
MTELLIGCGNDRRKKITFPQTPSDWTQLVTLDIDASTKPDIVHDLNVLPYPFLDSTFDEIHAYEVLEHCGRQGDWKFFLDQFAELWRILKPGGFLVATCPMWDGPWAWGDPGHTRVISRTITRVPLASGILRASRQDRNDGLSALVCG